MANSTNHDFPSVKEAAENFATFQIEDDTESAGVCNYLITRLTSQQAKRLSLDNVDLSQPLAEIIVPNCTPNTRQFAHDASKWLWSAGACEICFLSDAWFSVKETEEELESAVAPSEDPDHKHAWICVYLSRSGSLDSMMLEYQNNKIVRRINWGDHAIRSFSGPMLKLLQTALLDTLLDERKAQSNRPSTETAMQ